MDFLRKLFQRLLLINDHAYVRKSFQRLSGLFSRAIQENKNSGFFKKHFQGLQTNNHVFKKEELRKSF